eukprot:g5897.t1
MRYTSLAGQPLKAGAAICSQRPTVSVSLAFVGGYTEDGGLKPLFENPVSITDSDSQDMERAEVKITNPQAGDKLYASAATLTVGGNGTSTLVLTGKASIATYAAALQSIHFGNEEQLPDQRVRQVDVAVTDEDGGATSTTVALSFAVISVNDQPTVSGVPSSPLSWTEHEFLEIAPAIVIEDRDNTTLVRAKIALQKQPGDLLRLGPSFTKDSGMSSTTKTTPDGRLVLTLAGTLTVQKYRDALRSVQFGSDSEDPDLRNRVATITVNDGVTASVPVQRTIVVTELNDVPIITLSTTSVEFIEDAGPTHACGQKTVVDVDNTSFVSATARITTGYQMGVDVLAMDKLPAAIAAQFETSSGLLTLTPAGSATQAGKQDFQDALGNVTFESKTHNTTEITREVQFAVFDGAHSSEVKLCVVDVRAVNDAPTVSGVSSSILSITEGVESVIAPALVLDDEDDTLLKNASVQIVNEFERGKDALLYSAVRGIDGSWDADTGEMSLRASSGQRSVLEFQEALRQVKFKTESDNEIKRTIHFRVWDPQGSGSAGYSGTPGDANRVIGITGVNDAPVLILEQQESDISEYIENAPPQAFLPGTLTVNDDDDDNCAKATVQYTGKGLTLDTKDQYNLTAKVGNGAEAVSCVSVPFDVVPGPAHHLTVDQQPSDPQKAGVGLDPVVSVRDAGSNVVPKAFSLRLEAVDTDGAFNTARASIFTGVTQSTDSGGVWRPPAAEATSSAPPALRVVVGLRSLVAGAKGNATVTFTPTNTVPKGGTFE